MVFNAPHRESTLKKKGRRRQCCLPRCKSMGLLSHTEFTLHSFQCNDRPTLVLEIFLIFRVKSRMFLFSKAEVGLRHPLSLVISIRWKSTRKEGADCFASYLCHYGATMQDKYKKRTAVFDYLPPVGHPWFCQLPLRCQA